MPTKKIKEPMQYQVAFYKSKTYRNYEHARECGAIVRSPVLNGSGELKAWVNAAFMMSAHDEWSAVVDLAGEAFNTSEVLLKDLASSLNHPIKIESSDGYLEVDRVSGEVLSYLSTSIKGGKYFERIERFDVIKYFHLRPDLDQFDLKAGIDIVNVDYLYKTGKWESAAEDWLYNIDGRFSLFLTELLKPDREVLDMDGKVCVKGVYLRHGKLRHKNSSNIWYDTVEEMREDLTLDGLEGGSFMLGNNEYLLVETKPVNLDGIR